MCKCVLDQRGSNGHPGTYGGFRRLGPRARSHYHDGGSKVKKCAVKVVETNDAYARNSVKREISALMSLQTVYVSELITSQELSPTCSVIVMEYLPFSLRHLIGNSKYECNIGTFCKQIVSAFIVIQDYEIVHRDVKPENLMLTDSFMLKIVDFGSCRKIANNMTPGVSTILYKSPELLLGSPFTSKSENWSIGLVIAEVVQGRQLICQNTEIEVLEEQARLFRNEN